MLGTLLPVSLAEPSPAVAARPLDLLVIGAAKSGTTTLFHQLRSHPRLWFPEDKEAPFFAKDEVFRRGWDTFAAERFAGAPPDALWAKVTPRYLGDLHVPARIRAVMPDVRMAAILRNPIDRAYSKYRLLVRHGLESRSFAEVVEAQLDPAALARARSERVPIRQALLARGEYGRLLDGYLEHFPRQQLLLLLTDDLAREARQVVDQVLDFLGLDGGSWAAVLERRHYVGGDRQRFPWLLPLFRRSGPLRRLWHRVPAGHRRTAHRWYSHRLNVVRRPPGEIDPGVRRLLAELYRPDVRRLQELLGRPVPWPELR